MLSLMRLDWRSAVVARRYLATKPIKKADPKKADDKAKDAKKKEPVNWSNKEQEKDKNTDFFVKLMLNEEKRVSAARAIKRGSIRTLWEKQVGKRYQQEMSRQSNRHDFAIHCAMRIRDAAIDALPTEELRREARMARYDLRAFPLSRRAAAWTPPKQTFTAEDA